MVGDGAKSPGLWPEVADDDSEFAARGSADPNRFRTRGHELGRGSVFAERFRIERYIAQGGMGSIWEAVDLATSNARVALKVMTRWAEAGPQTHERFRREALMASRLMGAHFPEMISFGVDHEVPWIALEFLDGETLAQRLKRTKKLEPRECLKVAREVGTALGQAHTLGIVHRDVTPKNLFYAKAPDGTEVMKILDFGIAKHVFFDSKLTEPGSVVGSPHYMSPEQARSGEVDARSDLWALGVILYRCLLARRPFEGEFLQLLGAILKQDPPAPSSLVRGLGPMVDEFFRVALTKDKAGRFQTAMAMVGAFEATVASIPTSSSSSSGVRAVVTDRPPNEEATRTVIASPGYEGFAEQMSRERPIRSDHPTALMTAPPRSDDPTRIESAPELDRISTPPSSVPSNRLKPLLALAPPPPPSASAPTGAGRTDPVPPPPPSSGPGVVFGPPPAGAAQASSLGPSLPPFAPPPRPAPLVPHHAEQAMLSTNMPMVLAVGAGLVLGVIALAIILLLG